MPSPAQIEQDRQTRIDAGTRRIREMFDTQFTPDYYKQNITDPATKVYTQGKNDQYTEALRQLNFALARTGNFNSSLRDRKMGLLQKQNDLAGQTIAGRVQDITNARRQNVASAESMAQSQLLASANPEAAAAQSADLIKANSDPGSFAPLGQIFTDLSAGLATQADLEREGKNRYDWGVSNWGNNFKRYTQNVFGGP